MNADDTAVIADMGDDMNTETPTCKHDVFLTHRCRDCENDLDTLPKDCVGCGRRMSIREAAEQGVCDACATVEP